MVFAGIIKDKERADISLMYSMMSARSLSFFMPANTIFVPGMYFFGFTRYSNMCLSDQMMPEFLLASEYAKPSTEPEARPKSPKRGGPCLTRPPFSIVWHCAHFPLKSFAPFLASPAGTSTLGSAMTIVLVQRYLDKQPRSVRWQEI